MSNLSRFVTVYKDYLFVPDIYKNFQVFLPKNAEELAEDKAQPNIILLKKVYQSKIDSNCVAVFPVEERLTRQPSIDLSEIDSTKLTTVLSASLDGTVRLYGVRKQKNLEILG